MPSRTLVMAARLKPCPSRIEFSRRFFGCRYGSWQGLNRLWKNSAQVPKERPKVRLVQISWLVDSAGLILLDKRVLRPGIAKSGCG